MASAANANFPTGAIAPSITNWKRDGLTFWDGKIGNASKTSPGIEESGRALENQYNSIVGHLAKGDLIKANTKNKYVFPARYYTKTEEEKEFELHNTLNKQYAAGVQGSGLQVTATMPQSAVKWQEARERAKVIAAFDSYIEEAFMNDSLTDKEWLRRVYPEYFQARIQEVDAKQELDKKIFNLKLFGPQDIEDLRLQWMLASGMIIPDTKPIWDNSDTVSAGAGLERGFANVLHWLPVPAKSVQPFKNLFAMDGMQARTTDPAVEGLTSSIASGFGHMFG